MTGITDIDPVDFAGGVAHVAAAQLFQYLAALGEGDEASVARTWFCGASEEPNDVQNTVSLLSGYVGRTGAGGERLWRWGNIHGHVTEALPFSGLFSDLAPAHRLAFDLFAAVAGIAHRQVDELRENIIRRELEQTAAATPPALKLEDSIFEPHGSLGEIEPHRQQYLERQKQAALAEIETRRREEVEKEALSAGHAGAENEEKLPAAIVIGRQEGAVNAQIPAIAGQEESREAAPDPGAQGDLSGLSDDDVAGADPQGAGDDDGSAAQENASPVAAPLAKPQGESPAQETDSQVNAQKPARGKSAKRN